MLNEIDQALEKNFCTYIISMSWITETVFEWIVFGVAVAVYALIHFKFTLFIHETLNKHIIYIKFNPWPMRSLETIRILVEHSIAVMKQCSNFAFYTISLDGKFEGKKNRKIYMETKC